MDCTAAALVERLDLALTRIEQAATHKAAMETQLRELENVVAASVADLDVLLAARSAA